MTNLITLAETVGGEGLIHNIFAVLIVALVLGAIWWVGQYLLAKMEKPIVITVWNGFFLLIGLIIVINFLLGLIDRPFIRW